MTHAPQGRVRAAPHASHTSPKAALPLGTIVLTLDGALPVEYLSVGDRIITRAGMRVLRDIDTPAPQAFALTFDEPQVIYADGRQIHSDSGKEYVH